MFSLFLISNKEKNENLIKWAKQLYPTQLDQALLLFLASKQRRINWFNLDSFHFPTFPPTKHSPVIGEKHFITSRL